MKYDNKKPNLFPDEPWFVIRGRDALAVDAIGAYANFAKEAADRENDGNKSNALFRHALQCQQIVHRFLDWQSANKDKVRMPKPELRHGKRTREPFAAKDCPLSEDCGQQAEMPEGQTRGAEQPQTVYRSRPCAEFALAPGQRIRRAAMTKELDRQDALTTKMIGLLMVIAKMLEQAKTTVKLPDENEAAKRSARDYRLLIETAHRMFPEGDFEREVIEFARGLGFLIEQQYISPGTELAQ